MDGATVAKLVAMALFGVIVVILVGAAILDWRERHVGPWDDDP
jgi:hypothetical protein